ncbi:bifunctional helix-turn-helix transcriptional regulator/GNAT family N-acetyltransferase [Phytomonospora endophytica]|uniref:DNA-binding MarR family transcriptional regulator/GNAT superfamily N-acetyltransferase n=1 Tax=Phytomonospora endophytica TaxID=714109 RepID=A0A841FRI0_9ACTN|nr:helix-turn-helix domain-containing GNAT family N-acetyltransferase [Phytomonospora endophytica]MBB6034560.1 DNA-binding MarR family transcriptional regulator/GNAT superfamily N-acetyltransferase [Phytomonospora endophytica]
MTGSPAQIAAVRAFNRFYTKVIGTLGESLLDSGYTLTEARVLFELAQRESMPVVALRKELELDAGYLSRIVGRFTAAGFITRDRSPHDARQQILALTPEGRKTQAELDGRTDEQVAALLDGLSPSDRDRLVRALGTARDVLGGPKPREVTVRDARVGDHGWIVYRHGVLYGAEHGFDASFEGAVARIIADFASANDPERERTWIAELDGERAGCVMCVREDERTARLRVLLVEPWARGTGIGFRLVDECVDFARRAGYERMVLSTNHGLDAARRIYERMGFSRLDREGTHGHDVVDTHMEKWL